MLVTEKEEQEKILKKTLICQRNQNGNGDFFYLILCYIARFKWIKWVSKFVFPIDGDSNAIWWQNFEKSDLSKDKGQTNYFYGSCMGYQTVFFLLKKKTW